MKKFITVFFSLIAFSLFSQEKLCYNANWVEIKCSQDFQYYRIIPKNKDNNGLYPVKDYYKNNILQMEGTYSDAFYRRKTGEFKYYYENGKISAIENWKNNKIFGDFKKWYPNGQLKFEGKYDKPEGTEIYTNFWEENGNQLIKNGAGFYQEKEEDGSFEEGQMKDGKKDGIWKGYNAVSDFKYEEKYNLGDFVEGISTYNSNKYPYKNLQEIVYPVKGVDDFRNFISNNYSPPARIVKKKNVIAIDVIVIIDESGNIYDVIPENIIDNNVSQKIVKTVKKYPGKFIPGKLKGVPVKQKMRVPVTIIIE